MRNDNRGGNRRNNRDRPDPLLTVEWCRVIDHPESDAAIVVVTEPALHVIRLRPKPGAAMQMVGARIYMGIDHSKREVVQDVLGFARIRDLSNAANQEMPIVIQQIIEDSPEVFIQQFFNQSWQSFTKDACIRVTSWCWKQESDGNGIQSWKCWLG